MNMPYIKKSNSLTVEEVHKYLDTMRFTHNYVNFDVKYDGHQNPQNVHRKCFWPILMTNFDVASKLTLTCLNLITLYVNFLWTSSIVQLFDCLTWSDILTHHLNHPSPSVGYLYMCKHNLTSSYYCEKQNVLGSDFWLRHERWLDIYIVS